MNYNTINFSIAEGAATLTLNRPDSLNSFNQEMHAEVRSALAEISPNRAVRCLLLTGAGRGFCAGQDLGDRAVANDAALPDLGESIEKNYNPLIKCIRALPLPVICAVNGVAAGAGANIALACDIVLAARSASFIQAFCKIGLIPDSGGTWFLPRAVGLPRAMALSLLGEKIAAEQAAQWGMIWKCVDDEDLMAEARALAKHLAGQATTGLALTKKALQASMSNGLDQQLALEQELQGQAGRTQDYREGVAAFLEKRPATFSGE